MLLLASKSPRRKIILESMGIDFDVVSPEVDEHFEGFYYQDIPILNARLKTDAVAIENPVQAGKLLIFCLNGLE